MTAAHEIATGSIAGTVSVAIVRDPADRKTRFAVSYENQVTPWLSRHRLQDGARLNAGALTLAHPLGRR